MRHPRLLAVALLALMFIVPACTNSDKPTQLTSPGQAMHDGDFTRVNNCPVAYDTNDGVLEDDYKPIVHVSVNDADPNDVYDIIIVVNPHHGFTGVYNNVGKSDEVYYQPYPNFCGEDTLQYKVNDGTCDSNVAFMYITVECDEGDCPGCTTDQYGNCLYNWYPPHITVDAGDSGDFQINAGDPDGDPVTLAIATPPAHGVVVLNTGTGAGSYTPDPGYCGSDLFTFTVSDASCTSSPFTIDVNVLCPVVDADGDGVPDDDDDCSNSIVGGTIVIDGCDSGVANAIGEGAADVSGCTLADKIGADVAAASQSAKNHGKFVSSMAQRLNAMVKAGLINDAQKDALMHCVGSSSLNKAN